MTLRKHWTRAVLGLLATFTSAIGICAIFLVAPVYAQTGANPAACGPSTDSFLQFPTWYKYLNPTIIDGSCTLKADFPESIPAILLALFEIILRLGGIVAAVFVIWGGFQYIISQGDPDKVKTARSTIIQALVGMAITLSATAVVNLIGRNIV